MIYYNPNGPKNIVPLSKTIILSGVIEAMEISEMIRLVAKVSGTYLIWFRNQNCFKLQSWNNIAKLLRDA